MSDMYAQFDRTTPNYDHVTQISTHVGNKLEYDEKRYLYLRIGKQVMTHSFN